MERTGKSIVGLLILFVLSLSPAWASAREACNDSVPQQVGKQVAPQGYHIVEKGDTYYGLSRRYQIPADSLKRWNGETLKQGATVRVSFTAGKKTAVVQPYPAPATSPPAAAKPPVVAMAKPQVRVSPAPSPGAADSLTSKTATKMAKPAAKAPVAAPTTRSPQPGPAEFAAANKEAQRVLVIPFDPYLYFSDADNDIALYSDIPKQNVRYIFRARLNAFLDPKGFESINLLGGAFREGQSELDRIYKSVTYAYQPITYSKYNPLPATEKTGNAAISWLQKQKERLTAPPAPGVAGNTSAAKDPGQYYGVKVKDPDLYRYFNQHYAIDYYLFINQFEIHTDYTNCLDRTKNDFLREFLVHYTIYDNQGNLLAGNKVRVSYVSHINDIEKIVRDNLNKMAHRILADLPRPETASSQASSD